MTVPAVSVVMPSYNYKRYVGEAVRSVMDQTYGDFELIAVDDGSTDGSFEFLKEWEARFPDKIRVFTHEGRKNLGLVPTYREGLRRARGKVLAFLESDDVWHPQNLEKKMRVLEKHAEVGVVYSRYTPFGWRRGVIYWKIYEAANARGIPMGRPVDLFPFFLKRNPAASFSHFIVRKELLEGIPALKTARMNNDWWILAHLSARTSFYVVPEFLCFWRIHLSSLGFGRVDQKTLWRLRGFLMRLYRSLGEDPAGLENKRGYSGRKNLSKALLFQEDLKRRPRTALLKALARPFDLTRFLCYIALKNILFRPRSGPGREFKPE